MKKKDRRKKGAWSGKKGGAKTIYNPKMCKIAQNCAMMGMTDQHICEILGISDDSYYRYIKKYPEFKEAIQQGRHGILGDVAEKLYKTALGYEYTERTVITSDDGRITEKVEQKYSKPSIVAQKYIMSSRLGGEWRESSKVEMTGKDGGAIEIEDSSAKLALARKIAFLLADGSGSAKSVIEALPAPESDPDIDGGGE